MAGDLTGKKIAFLVAPEGIEQAELTEPWQAVKDAGGEPVLVSTEEGEVQAFNHLDRADTFPVDATIDAAGPEQYDGLILPGGVANPDYLRMQPEAVRFIKAFFDGGRPVAAVCHAAWTLVEAGVLQGRTLTSWPSLQTDIRNAGGHWVDEEVHIDTTGASVLVTSRNPGDLPAFGKAVVEHFSG